MLGCHPRPRSGPGGAWLRCPPGRARRRVGTGLHHCLYVVYIEQRDRTLRNNSPQRPLAFNRQEVAQVLAVKVPQIESAEPGVPRRKSSWLNWEQPFSSGRRSHHPAPRSGPVARINPSAEVRAAAEAIAVSVKSAVPRGVAVGECAETVIFELEQPVRVRERLWPAHQEQGLENRKMH